MTIHTMDTTIRNLDDAVYRAIKARAAVENRSIGELVSDAMNLYLLRPAAQEKTGSLRDWRPRRFPGSPANLSASAGSGGDRS